METHGVFLTEGKFDGDTALRVLLGLDPRLTAVPALREQQPQAEPKACDDVSDPQEEEHDLRDGRDEAQLLGHRDVLREFICHLGCLEQPEEANSADHAQTPQSGAELVHAAAAEARREQLGPIEADDEGVEREPRDEVAAGNLEGPHLDHAVIAHVADEEGHDHVEGPVQPDDPSHDVEHGSLRQLEHVQGDHDAIVADEEEACEVPKDPLLGTRMHHDDPQSAGAPKLLDLLVALQAARPEEARELLR
mmetsp:Transcript_132995/g.344139  ORF Transcript_132995/g.344139 Transcript_132995/m.344139 type:complete len:250 (+) Transcript_132995:1310-2059(+)